MSKLWISDQRILCLAFKQNELNLSNNFVGKNKLNDFLGWMEMVILFFLFNLIEYSLDERKKSNNFPLLPNKFVMKKKRMENCYWIEQIFATKFECNFWPSIFLLFPKKLWAKGVPNGWRGGLQNADNKH